MRLLYKKQECSIISRWKHSCARITESRVRRPRLSLRRRRREIALRNYLTKPAQNVLDAYPTFTLRLPYAKPTILIISFRCLETLQIHNKSTILSTRVAGGGSKPGKIIPVPGVYDMKIIFPGKSDKVMSAVL